MSSPHAQHSDSHAPFGAYIREVNDEEEDAQSVASVSTNYTESNRPGAGRTMGLLISYYGRRLENSLTTVALKFGRGPMNASLRVYKRLGKGRTPSVRPGESVASESALVTKEAAKDNAKARKDLKMHQQTVLCTIVDMLFI